MKFLREALVDCEQGLVYGEVVLDVLDAICSALHVCCQRWIEGAPLREPQAGPGCPNLCKELNDCFRDLNIHPHSVSNKNAHIRDGVNIKGRDARLARLTLSRFEEVQRYAKKQQGNEYQLLVPSPLSILYDALTVPSDPASRAYSLAACRGVLFLRMLATPFKIDGARNWSRFTVDEIEEILDSERRYFLHRDSPPIRADKAGELVQHFLAMKGFYVLRFGTLAKVPLTSKEQLSTVIEGFFHAEHRDIRGFVGKLRANDALRGLIRGIARKKDAPKETKSLCKHPERLRLFEYRLSPCIDDPPKALDVVNELVGATIGLKGMETVFYGALRRSSNASLVASVSGPAGSGKTSFALALAGATAPCGTRTYYISLEETNDDLRARLHAITPQYIRDLSISKNEIDFLFVDELGSKEDTPPQPRRVSMTPAEMSNYVDKIRLSIGKAGTTPSLNQALGSIPLIVVVDGIHGLHGETCATNEEDLSEFVRSCRELGATVLLLSSDELPRRSRLSYLVDLFVSLDYAGTSEVSEKPRRIFRLSKTRYQLSRPGAHLFHMSGRDGFRISPQLSSLLDREVQQNIYLPDQKKAIEILNRWDESLPLPEGFSLAPQSGPFLTMFANSHILVHGHGSSGKSAFGMRILADPLAVSDITWPRWPRRILVVSFLYPQSYYEMRHKKILQAMRARGEDTTGHILESLTFAPGYLQPEDFLGTVLGKIEEARLNGLPFTGVLLDGIHNVFLSFPDLQDRQMVWPMLYRMLSIHRFTTVTTFTTFVLDLDRSAESSEEREVRLKGHLPFMHALVQRVDFYLTIERLSGAQPKQPDCIIKVRQCIGQRLPENVLLWHSDKMTLTPPLVQPVMRPLSAFDSVESVRQQDLPKMASSVINKGRIARPRV